LRNLTPFIVALALVAGALSLVPSVGEAQQMEDVVYLKDGSVLRGMITETIPGESILIQTRDGNTFRITMDRIDRMTKEAVQGARAPQAGVGKKSPVAAWALSFLIPGAGQAYNGQWGKAGFMFGGAVVGSALIQGYVADCYDWDESCELYGIGIAAFLTSWIWSQIDAPMTASRLNRERGFALELGPQIHYLASGINERTTLPIGAEIRRTPRFGLSLARVSF